MWIMRCQSEKRGRVSNRKVSKRWIYEGRWFHGKLSIVARSSVLSFISLVYIASRPTSVLDRTILLAGICSGLLLLTIFPVHFSNSNRRPISVAELRRSTQLESYKPVGPFWKLGWFWGSQCAPRSRFKWLVVRVTGRPSDPRKSRERVVKESRKSRYRRSQWNQFDVLCWSVH